MIYKIGFLYKKICEFKNIKPVFEKLIDVRDLKIKIQDNEVSHVIKKRCSGLKIVFNKRHNLVCAENHILYNPQDEPVYAKKLQKGDKILTKSGLIEIQEIKSTRIKTFYDICVNNEDHTYYDANGVKHHNTIATAVLCDQVNKKYGRCVVVVPSTDLVIQTAAEMRSMGLEVGEVRAGMKEFDKKNVVATWQSIMHTEARSKGQTLAGKEVEKEVEWLNQHELQLLVQDLACVICDECQILAGQEAFNQFTDLFKNIPIRWGLTGTVPKDRYENIKLKIALGNIILRIGASRLQAAGFLAKSKIIVYRIEDDFQTPVVELTSGAASAWQIEKDHLATFEPRLRYIAQELIKIGQNGNTLALVSSISTGKLLSKMIKEEDVDCEFLSGSDSANKRKKEYDKINKSNNKILIATKQIAAVGLNIPRLFNIVFIDLGNSYVKTIQAVGRGLRKSYDKDAVTIYDFSSTTRISKKHCAARVKMFKNEGHEVQIIDVPKPW